MALNHDLSELFRQMAAIMDIKGESVFKSIAFSKVSRLLKDMTFDIRKAHADGTLKEIEGIGDSPSRRAGAVIWQVWGRWARNAQGPHILGNG